MSSTAILVIQIISMLPYIESQQRPQALLNGVRSIRLLCNHKFPVLVCRQPHPARTKQSDTLGLELSLKSLKRTKITSDDVSELSRGLIIWITRIAVLLICRRFGRLSIGRSSHLATRLHNKFCFVLDHIGTSARKMKIFFIFRAEVVFYDYICR